MMRGRHEQLAPASSTYRTLRQRLLAKNPALAWKLEEMRLPLSPLVHICSGLPHPEFPLAVLQFWLLTDAQLESLAHFYHQRTPGPLSAHYPCPITWDSRWPLEQKRRKIGQFIGLKGCLSPLKTEEQILEEVRREAMREEEEALCRGKMYP